jgi:pyruvate dehydrogenase E2 component (dihydrolipoamide acetyltransferase)
MAFVFELPEIGEGVVEGEIVAWLVGEGEAIQRDAPLCEIMTDKATVEISSPTSGTVSKLHGEPGDIVQVHSPLAEIDESGAPAAAPAPKTAAAPAPKPTPAPVAAPRPAPVATSAAAQPSAALSDGPPKATPAVRRRAHEEGVNLRAVTGTGPSGRITHADVDHATSPTTASPNAAGPNAGVLPASAVALPQVRPSGSEERIKIIGLRRKIAEAMVKSKRTAPHFTYVEEVDGTELVALRKRLKTRAANHGVKLTYLPFLMKAASVVFREFPNVNAVMDEDKFELVVKGDHNIGVSIDTPNGLFVGVVRNIEQKSILRIATELQSLVERVRSGTASREDLTGGTFTLTSTGSIGGVLATPILNHPEVAILGFNAIRERPMVVNGDIVARHMFYLSPSFDHRVIDGAIAARFTAALKAVLEQPETLLLELV